MWGGVTRGLAGVKFSGSPSRFGENSASSRSKRINSKKPRRSLYEKYGWNGTLSVLDVRPVGLFEPVSCKKSRWSIDAPIIANGSRKWNVKNRVRVALSTEKPPQIHSTKVVPIYGTAESRFVITVAPQNDICPHGRTYPTKAVAITRSRRTTPIFHVSL